LCQLSTVNKEHSDADEQLSLIHLHYVDAAYCSERERKKHDNAIARGKKDSEAGLGLNQWTNLQFQQIFATEGVCQWALAKAVEPDRALFYLDEWLERIPAQWIDHVFI
jgi:hypothetical protein